MGGAVVGGELGEHVPAGWCPGCGWGEGQDRAGQAPGGITGPGEDLALSST